MVSRGTGLQLQKYSFSRATYFPPHKTLQVLRRSLELAGYWEDLRSLKRRVIFGDLGQYGTCIYIKREVQILKRYSPRPVAQRSLVGYGLFITEASRSHSVTHTTLGWTPLDEWSARRIHLYLTHNTHKRQTTKPRRNSNPQSQQASGRSPTHQTARPPGSALRRYYRHNITDQISDDRNKLRKHVETMEGSRTAGMVPQKYDCCKMEWLKGILISSAHKWAVTTVDATILHYAITTNKTTVCQPRRTQSKSNNNIGDAFWFRTPCEKDSCLPLGSWYKAVTWRHPGVLCALRVHCVRCSPLPSVAIGIRIY